MLLQPTFVLQRGTEVVDKFVGGDVQRLQSSLKKLVP